jgi:hypothetical protein
MAQYQVGDVVIALHPFSEDDDPIRAVVTAVDSEGEDEGLSPLYTLAAQDDPELAFEELEENIVTLIDGPTMEQRMQAGGILGEQRLVREVRPNVASGMVFGTSGTLDPRPTDDMGFMWNTPDTFRIRHHTPTVEPAMELHLDEIPLPEPERVEPIALPPILPAPERPGGVMTYHYRLDDLSRITNLFAFRLGGTGRVLTPRVAEGTRDQLEFADANGIVWVNNFQHSEVSDMIHATDTFGIHWVQKIDYIRLVERRRDTATLRTGRVSLSGFPKKRLRRKYDKMPEIKEAKYYADKKFIA